MTQLVSFLWSDLSAIIMVEMVIMVEIAIMFEIIIMVEDSQDRKN